MNDAKEAIEFHTQDLKDEGQEVPKKEDLLMGRVDVRAASAWNFSKELAELRHDPVCSAQYRNMIAWRKTPNLLGWCMLQTPPPSIRA
jgi:hypothetical protein